MKKMPITIFIILDVDSKLFDVIKVVDSRAFSSSEDIKASLNVQSNMQPDKSSPLKNPMPRQKSKVVANKMQGRTLATKSNPTFQRIATNSNPTLHLRSQASK
jgi:hypothetical protein